MAAPFALTGNEGKRPAAGKLSLPLLPVLARSAPAR
jgi:hypothetical protein